MSASAATATTQSARSPLNSSSVSWSAVSRFVIPVKSYRIFISETSRYKLRSPIHIVSCYINEHARELILALLRQLGQLLHGLFQQLRHATEYTTTRSLK